MEYNEILKSLRITNNLTQNDLAKLCNIEQTTYSLWERKKTQPSIENIIKLSNFYKVSIDYLLGNEEEDGRIIVQEIELPSDERQLINNYRELPEELKSSCIEYTKTMNNLNKEFINNSKNKTN